MYANYGSRAFVVRVAGSRKEKSNLYIEERSETPARSHRRTGHPLQEERDKKERNLLRVGTIRHG